MQKKKKIIFQIFRAVIEIQITTSDFRDSNIQHIFERTIYRFPDVCDVYDDCFERLKKESKWYHTDYMLHERAYKLTLTLLAIMYENRL